MEVKWQWLNFNLYMSFPDPDPDHVFMKGDLNLEKEKIHFMFKMLIGKMLPC